MTAESHRVVDDTTISLRDGRRLGVCTVGDPKGTPILHFHGRGESRLEVALVAESAAAAGVRLIGLDRPGVGRSDPVPDFAFVSWPDDVGEAADQLGLDRFAIEGVSAGGAYAMACVDAMPQRLTVCCLVSSVVPPELIMKSAPAFTRFRYWVGKRYPEMLRRRVKRLLPVGTDRAAIEKGVQQILAGPPAEQRTFAGHERQELLADILSQGLIQGPDAAADESVALVQPWGLAVENLSFERMFLWHGDRDQRVPIASARLLARTLPRCTAHFYPDEAHLSTFVNHAAEFWTTAGIA